MVGNKAARHLCSQAGALQVQEECGGSQICVHGLGRDCGGGGFYIHGKRRAKGRLKARLIALAGPQNLRPAPHSAPPAWYYNFW